MMLISKVKVLHPSFFFLKKKKGASSDSSIKVTRKSAEGKKVVFWLLWKVSSSAIDNLFNNESSKICGIQFLKNLKWCGLFNILYLFIFFKGFSTKFTWSIFTSLFHLSLKEKLISKWQLCKTTWHWCLFCKQIELGCRKIFF